MESYGNEKDTPEKETDTGRYFQFSPGRCERVTTNTECWGPRNCFGRTDIALPSTLSATP